MARVRNRLVHIHGDVDGGTLFDILNQRIPDLRRFLRDHGTFIQRLGKESSVALRGRSLPGDFAALGRVAAEQSWLPPTTHVTPRRG
jgi:hypothetical protein